MKIAAIDTFLLQTDLAPAEVFGWSLRWAERRSALYVKITSDEGVSGWAEAGVGGNPVMRTAIEHHFKPLLLGRDPFDVEVLWEEMYALTQDAGQKGEVLDAISAIDVALWDLLGRTLGKPVHKLLGGAHRTRVMAYASAQYYSRLPDHLEHRVEEAKRNVHRGFRALKMKVGGLPMREDLTHVEAVRQAVPDETILLTDANHAYTVHAPSAWTGAGALRHRLVRGAGGARGPGRVRGGEAARWTSRWPAASASTPRYGFRALFEKRAVEHRPARHLPRGRLLRDEKILALASAHQTLVAPHVFGVDLSVAVNLQLCAIIPMTPRVRNPEVLVQEPILE